MIRRHLYGEGNLIKINEKTPEMPLNLPMPA